MNGYEYIGSMPTGGADPFGEKWKCCVNKQGKRVQNCGQSLSKKQVIKEVAWYSNTQVLMYTMQDVATFGEKRLNARTFYTFTEKRVAEMDISKIERAFYSKVREGVIDCFVGKDLFPTLAKRWGAKTEYSEIEAVARGIWSETTSWNCGMQTKVLLAAVIKNRRDLSNFPATYSGVLAQPAQFSGWPGKAKKYSDLNTAEHKLKWAVGYIAALYVDGTQTDPSDGADHFVSPYVTKDWAKKKMMVTPRIPVDYLTNVKNPSGKGLFQGAGFVFFDLIDDKGRRR